MGYCQVKNTYYKKRYIQTTSYYDEAGKPDADLDGIHMIKYRYGRKDNYVIAEEYYDVSGRRTVNGDGVGGILYTNDKDGKRLSTITVDAENKRVVNAKGYDEIRCEYEDGRWFPKNTMRTENRRLLPVCMKRFM